MDSSYSKNSMAQSICHKLSASYLKSICQKIIKSDYSNINIAFFGCGPGNNDINAFNEYMLPHIRNKYIFNRIEVFMIDIIDTKWTGKREKISENTYVTGYTYDIYKQMFKDDYLDIVLSFSCLHWFNELPDMDKNNYCWSLLNIEERKKIKTIVNNNIKLFLDIRNKELKENGQIILSLDADKENNSHQFQKTSEIFSKCLNSLSKNLTNTKLFQNFFIKTCPQSIDDIKTILDTNANLSCETILIKKARCIFFDKLLNQKYRYTKLDYVNDIVESFLACIIPSLKNSVRGYNCYLEKKIQEEFFNYVFFNNLEHSSTDGNVLLIHLQKVL